MPVVRRRDDDGVHVLVVHHPPEVLDEVRLEGRDVGQTLVVDPRRREVRVDVAERLDLDVRQPREAALERVALAANADARRDDAIVGADDAVADVRRRLDPRAQEIAADGDTRRCRPNSRCELAPRDSVLLLVIAGHADLLMCSAHRSTSRKFAARSAEKRSIPPDGLCRMVLSRHWCQGNLCPSIY
jgi:hypothetical protein